MLSQHQITGKNINKIPRTREELMKLPGVGRKAANVVLNNAFGQHTSIWYSCLKVSNAGLAPGKAVEIVEKLIKNIPDEFKKRIPLANYT